MSSGNRSAVLALRDALDAFFKANGVNAVVGLVGRREYSRQDNAAPGTAGRVLLIQPEKGDRGNLVRGRQNANPGVTLEWDRPLTISVWAADPTNSGDEIAQLAAAEDLFEQTIQACEQAVDPVTKQPIGFANVVTPMKVEEISTQNQERYFGVELRFSFTLKTLLFRREYATGRGSVALTGEIVKTSPTAAAAAVSAVPNLTGGN